VVCLEALGVAAGLGYTGCRGPVALESSKAQGVQTPGEIQVQGSKGEGPEERQGLVGGGEGRGLIGVGQEEERGRRSEGWGGGWRHRGEYKRKEGVGHIDAWQRCLPASHAILFGGAPRPDPGAPPLGMGEANTCMCGFCGRLSKAMAVGAWGDYFEPLTLLTGSSGGSGQRQRAGWGHSGRAHRCCRVWSSSPFPSIL